MNFTVDRPNLNTDEEVQKRFEQTGLTYGSTTVCKYKEIIYWNGDHEHEPKGVLQNLKVMYKPVKDGILTYYAKSYDSDLYQSSKRITPKDFEDIKHLNPGLRQVVTS